MSFEKEMIYIDDEMTTLYLFHLKALKIMWILSQSRKVTTRERIATWLWFWFQKTFTCQLENIVYTFYVMFGAENVGG